MMLSLTPSNAMPKKAQPQPLSVAGTIDVPEEAKLAAAARELHAMFAASLERPLPGSDAAQSITGEREKRRQEPL
jgi:hypothetical protein